MAEQKKSRIMPSALILSGVEGLVLLTIILLTKSAEGGIILGLSTARMAIAAGVLIGTALLFCLGLRWHSRARLATRIRKAVFKHTANLILVLFWAFVFSAFLQSPTWYQIIFFPFKPLLSPQLHPQLRPLLVWITTVLIQLVVGLTFDRKTELESIPPRQRILLIWGLLGAGRLLSGGGLKNQGYKHWQTLWNTHKTSLLIFLGMLVLWAGVATTKIGLTPDTKFWNIAGIPILWHQMIFTVLLVLFLFDFSKTTKGTRLDTLSQKTSFPVLVIILIWAAAVLVWQAEPLRHTYFSPGPYPPNYVKYPFSDARWFDTGGQYFLVGEGLFNNLLTDRPYLMLYHAFLHLLGGQDYDLIAFFQIILLAIIPAGLFLIGWKLDAKIAGLATAVLYIFKEKNAIEGAFQIGLVNTKTLTSELPTALLLVLIAICLINWFQQKKPKLLWPVLAGGLSGLAVGFRGNSLTIIPLILLLALFIFLKRRTFAKQWLTACIFFILGAGAVLAPYSINNIQNFGSPFWLIKIENVINRSEESPIPYLPAGQQQKVTRVDQQISPFALVGGYTSLAAGHFVHNEITTLLMLPFRWRAVPLEEAIGHPIWDPEKAWEGNLAPGEFIAVGINLIVLAFGLGTAFRLWGITGLAPLAIHLTYNLTSGAAHTSGGRYLVPTDWVLILYFALGILHLIQILRGWEPSSNQPMPQVSPARDSLVLPVVSLFGFLLFGSTFLISGMISPPFELGNRQAYWETLEAQRDNLADLGIEISLVESFLEGDNAVLNLGLALYPRYYAAGEETQISSHLPRIPAEDARMYFLMLEEDNPRHVSITLLPDEPAALFPHGAYGLILGCKLEDYTQGKIFIPLDAPDSDILTEGNLSLTCD